MWKFACRNLLSRPTRSALSLMGLTVAIAGMVGLFAVKEGLEKAVDEAFQLIPGLSIMQPGAPVPLFSKLPAEWREELKEIEGVGVVNPQIIQRANLVEGKALFSPPTLLFGMDIPSRLRLKKAVYRESLKEGRFLVESDQNTGNAVISRQLADQFGKSVGDTLEIDGETIQIVGIYQTGMALLDVSVLMDIETVRRIVHFDNGSVSAYYIEKSGDDIDDERLKGRIEDQFRGRELVHWRPSSALGSEFRTGNPLIDAAIWLARRFGISKPANTAEKTKATDPDVLPIEVRSANDWGKKLQEFSQDLDIFLTIMTGIGISIAVLSIINTMLMSVSERIIEFGILKANGWSRGDVMKLITFESATIGLSGGILGAIFGWIATQVINNYWPDKVGFIFQNFNLLGNLNAVDNVLVPFMPRGVTADERKRAVDLLEQVGLGARLHHRPNQLSGGEQQRVAIARALMKQPSLVLADEPTGELDSATGAEIFGHLRRLHAGGETTIVVVTHDERYITADDNVLRMLDGLVDTTHRDRGTSSMTAVESEHIESPPWYDRASDWFNAILIKEARQSFKSRLFVTTFMLLLAVSWVVSVFLLLNSGDSLEYGSVGRDFFYGFYLVLAFATLVVVPFNAFRSLLSERDLNTYDLLSITTLSPWQIVWGKLFGSMVQLFVFYSAVTPFIAFSSLMQGFSTPSAAFILIGTMLMSLQLSMTTLMLSTLARNRAMQGLISIAVLGGLFFGFAFDTWFVYMTIESDLIAVANPEFWWAICFALIAMASYGYLFQKITIAQLTFESDNRSTGIRAVGAAQFWLLWIVYFIYLLVQGQPFERITLFVFTWLSGLHWVSLGLFATTEGDFLSRRVRREVPRNRLWRLIKAPFLPGGARGYLYVVLHLVALWLIVAVSQALTHIDAGGDFGGYVANLYYLQSSSWSDVLRVATAVCCYLAIYLGIATALARWGRAVSNEVKPAHIRVLTFLLFTAGMIFPLLLRATDFVKNSKYTLYDITNPRFTIEELGFRHPRRSINFDFSDFSTSLERLVVYRGYGDIVLVMLLAGAAVAIFDFTTYHSAANGLQNLQAADLIERPRMQNDPDVQYAVNAFQLALARMPVAGRTGEFLGRATGSSLEFQEYREYAPGDDIRHLDWAAYGRSDALMVRLYREEISPHTEILLDGSQSMTTGEGQKEHLTRQLVTLLALLTGRLGGRATVHLIDDSPAPVRLPANQLDDLAGRPFSGTTGLNEALQRGNLQLGRQAVRIVVSDFLFPHDPESMIRQLATGAGHLWVLQVLGQWEADPEPLGGRKLVDAETAAESNLILDRKAVNEYKTRLHHLQDELARSCRRVHANFVTLIAERGLRETCRTDFARLELDRAVLYALLLRGWQLIAGAASAVLIAHFFTADVQGYYYTFSSLMTLQALFELGCAQVVTNVASHEWSKLELDSSGRIVGDPAARSRLVSLGRLLFKLYGAAFALFVVVVGFGGALFLESRPAEGVAWEGPWYALVVVSGLLLWTLPFNALLEGCHQVTTVNRFRLIQAVAANLVVWTSLVLGLNLWVAVAATAARVVCELVLIGVRFRRFFRPFRARADGEQIDWKQELWPLQWRLGLQSAGGFLANSLYVPVLFRYQSKAVAGQMGMTWMMIFTVQAAALSWIQTRIPRFGALIAEKQYAELDRLFRKVTVISVGAVSLGGVALCGGVWLLNALQWQLAERILNPLDTAIFMAGFAILQLSHCQAAYIRAHKRDPLLRVNLASYVLIGAGVWYFGAQYGPTGAGLAYLSVIVLVTAPFHTLLWNRCRADWH
eukprot:g22035.t1